MARAPRYQPRDHAPRLIAKRNAPKIRKAFHAALVRVRSLVDVHEVAKLLRNGARRSAIEKAIQLGHWRESLKDAFETIGATVEEGGQHASNEVSQTFKRSGRTPRYQRHPVHHLRHRGQRIGIMRKAAGVGFDRFDADTQQRIRDYQDELIAELESQARDSIEATVLAGLRAGESADEIAAEIRDSISLTATQAQAVANFRQLLEDGDPAAVDRALRDDSFDNVVDDLIAGEDVSDDVISQMVDAYAENYLDYRAQTIADTESLRASVLGIHEGYSQAIERGVMPSDAVTRKLLLALDEKTCQFCIDTEAMNADGVAVDEPWQTPDGPVMNSPFHPSCRCDEQYETDLSQLSQDDTQDQEEVA